MSKIELCAKALGATITSCEVGRSNTQVTFECESLPRMWQWTIWEHGGEPCAIHSSTHCYAWFPTEK